MSEYEPQPFELRYVTPAAWTDAVLRNVDAFLSDHAHAERKVSAAALALATQNPRRPELVEAMIELAREELGHFKQVYQLIIRRGKQLVYDVPDPYMRPLQAFAKNPRQQDFLLDRLVLYSVVEARGCERFERLADAFEDPELRDFYVRLAVSERRHQGIFLALAHRYFPEERVLERLDIILDAEAESARNAPIRAALH
jgi:tRNA-(ms[2]io[6]A)-hydroxylase